MYRQTQRTNSHPQEKEKPLEWTDRDGDQKRLNQSLYSPTRCQYLRSLSHSVRTSGFPSSWGWASFPIPSAFTFSSSSTTHPPPLARMTPSTTKLQYDEKLNAECDGLDVRDTPSDTLFIAAQTPTLLSIHHLAPLLLALLLLLLLRRIHFGHALVGTRHWYHPWGLGVSMSTGQDCFLFVLERVEEFCFLCPVIVRSLCCALSGGRQPRLGRGRAACLQR
jgi:hypothetical protein